MRSTDQRWKRCSASHHCGYRSVRGTDLSLLLNARQEYLEGKVSQTAPMSYIKQRVWGSGVPPIASIVGCTPPQPKSPTILKTSIPSETLGIYKRAFTSTPHQHRDRILTFDRTHRHSSTSADTKAPLAGAFRVCRLRSLFGDERQKNGARLYGTSRVMPGGKALQEVGRLGEVQPSH